MEEDLWNRRTVAQIVVEFVEMVPRVSSNGETAVFEVVGARICVPDPAVQPAHECCPIGEPHCDYETIRTCDWDIREQLIDGDLRLTGVYTVVCTP